MENAQHTPGPWFAGNSGNIGKTVIGIHASEKYPMGRVLAQIGGNYTNDAENEANARLIAAAPDLLRSADICQSRLHATLEMCQIDSQAKADIIAVIGSLTAAIAKATGGQS